MNEDFKKLYNSAKGIVSIADYSIYDDITIASAEFNADLYELEHNPDFTTFGNYETIEDANDDLLYQGLTLDDITKLSMHRYGNMIEVLKSPMEEQYVYWVFVGAK